MSHERLNFYRHWREQNQTVFREDSIPPERLLQAIWHHQRLLRDELKTADGKSIRILHPGFWNREAGPDFREAVIQIAGEIKTGDIEIDLQSAGWRGHGHDRNPNFKNVVLHVVWDIAASQTGIPQLILKPFLDAPLADIKAWLGTEAAQGWPTELHGQCSAPLRELPPDKMQELLRQAAQIRFERKAQEFGVRARHVGWEQALWEGIFRALGYKQNVWPLRRVAELLPLIKIEKASPLLWQVRLLGISGLLPAELSDQRGEANPYLRRIWDAWWREREKFSEHILPKAVWKFSGLRPANRPERRLALVSHWLSSDDFLRNIEEWFTSDHANDALSLFETLQVRDDEFWSCHWTFRSAPLAKPQPLIGEKRITDLAINVILPWFWMRAVAGKNFELQKKAEERFFNWPAAEDNSILRLARLRLLAKSDPRLFRTASAQQGLLQIVRDFCEHSNSLCSNCRFPDLIRQWKAG